MRAVSGCVEGGGQSMKEMVAVKPSKEIGVAPLIERGATSSRSEASRRFPCAVGEVEQCQRQWAAGSNARGRQGDADKIGGRGQLQGLRVAHTDRTAWQPSRGARES